MRLDESVGGVPVWSWGAMVTITVLAWTAFHKQSKSSASAPGTAAVPTFVVVETPQTVTPYNLPVTRVGGSRLSSVVS